VVDRAEEITKQLPAVKIVLEAIGKTIFQTSVTLIGLIAS
jgi:hypothetical protein